MIKFTKIIATIGPASDSVEKIKEMQTAGMNIARLNFSHGSYEYFEKVISNIRAVSSEIAILLDTKGPEIRTGQIENGSLELFEGEILTLTKEQIITNNENRKLTVNYNLLEKLDVGNTVLIDDGSIECVIIEKKEKDLVAKVLNGGKLGSKKTVSIRGHNVQIPFLSEKDKEDLLFGIKHNLDFVAASFVRTKKDVIELKEFLDKNNSNMMVISKIEHQDAVDNISDIIESSQGIMVARGDLGVEMPLEKVPQVQIEIIKKCNMLGRPVIVATQMLESMKESPRPTRAEVGDVANAILQGTDAIMLSGETASGKYPIKAVKMMTTIAKEYDMKVKNNVLENYAEKLEERKDISLFVTKSAYHASVDLKAKAIIAPTESGYTPRKVSRFKPKCPIYAITRDERVFRQMQISWGVFPSLEKKEHTNHDEMVNDLVNNCYKKKLLLKEDTVVVTTGHVIALSGFTNMLEVYKVESILDRMK